MQKQITLTPFTPLLLLLEMTQSDAPSVFGVNQPRLNQLLQGKIQLFSLDALVNMLANAGMRVTMSVKQAA